MTFVFDENCRERVAGLCAGFERLPDDDSGRHLKRAAVAITLVEAESVRARRLLLCARTLLVLESGLSLLGLRTLQRM